MPERVQLSRRAGFRKPKGAVVVARPTRWGNPIRVQLEGREWWVRTPSGRNDEPFTDKAVAAARAVDLYRRVIVGRSSRMPGAGSVFPTPALIRKHLAGRDLACWCPLDQPCHADVLLEIANPGPVELQARSDLAEVYTPEGVEIWLTAPNRMLGGRRAVDLIRDGEGDKVLAAIDVLRSGAFA